jgi:hypothetical protein
MSPGKLAKIVTPVVILALLLFVAGKKNGFQWRVPPTAVQQAAKADATPQDTIYATLEDARAGDSRAYLNLYSGSTRVTLEQTQREKGDSGFRDYLKRSSGELKGLAMFDPKPVGDGAVEVRVEYVYQDRNESQLFRLEKSPAGWKITSVLDAERVKTLVPYGTPVQ